MVTDPRHTVIVWACAPNLWSCCLLWKEYQYHDQTQEHIGECCCRTSVYMKHQPALDPTNSFAIWCLILTNPCRNFMRACAPSSLWSCCLRQSRHCDECCGYSPASLISGICIRNGFDPVLSPSLLLHLLDTSMVSLQLSRHLLLIQTILWSSLSPSFSRATLVCLLQTYTSTYGHARNYLSSGLSCTLGSSRESFTSCQCKTA